MRTCASRFARVTSFLSGRMVRPTLRKEAVSVIATATRPMPACSHGVSGFCWDDATQEVRERVDLYHRLAFEWAYLHQGVCLDVAEAYAAWYVRENWTVEIEDAPRQSSEDLVRIREEGSW